jgi:hypothetical protein
MQNVNMAVKGDLLTITVDLSKRLGESASKKSLKVASTDGNIEVPEHPEYKIGLNIYVPTPSSK